MMSFNPELQRNVWLQMSWSRLVVAPLLIGILMASVIATVEPPAAVMAEAARWFFVIFMGFWSTRRVADSLAEEIGGGTWEGQRMSGLSAWSMMWGKLFGGAIFPWYCGLICLGVMVWYGLKAPPADLRLPVWHQVATLLVGAILAQATSLTVALVLLRKVQFRRRLTVTMAQIAGLLVFALALMWDYNVQPAAADGGQITWYDRTFDGWIFYIVSLAVFALWALLAVLRLMSLELLYATRPWAWALFVLFVMGYAAGFHVADVISMQVLSWRLFVAYLMAGSLTYVGFFAEAKDPVRYRWGLARFGAMQWWRALEFMPWWLISYILAVIAGAAAIWSVALGGQLAAEQTLTLELERYASWAALGPITYRIAAALLFLLRDMLFLLWLNFSRTRNRADLSGLVILVILYVPLPMLLTAAGLVQFLPAVAPIAVSSILAIAWPALEALVMAILLYLRWRKAARIEIVDDHDEPTMTRPS
ncbi:MAG TPA: hypothetical protein VG742_23110 [Dongiaceae bacterium]|nr:hypothetical protein [Dongiaceae bacterium]